MIRYKVYADMVDEPLTLDEVKDTINIDTTCTGFDDLLFSYITAARQIVEAQTNYSLGVKTIDIYLDAFPQEIAVEVAPIATLSHVKYYDGANAIQTLSGLAYEADLLPFPARIRPAHGYTWPSTYDRYDAVTLRVVTSTGYPKPLLTAMKMIIGHWYENRQDVVVGHQANEIPQTSRHIMDIYRLHTLR